LYELKWLNSLTGTADNKGTQKERKKQKRRNKGIVGGLLREIPFQTVQKWKKAKVSQARSDVLFGVLKL